MAVLGGLGKLAEPSSEALANSLPELFRPLADYRLIVYGAPLASRLHQAAERCPAASSKWWPWPGKRCGGRSFMHRRAVDGPFPIYVDKVYDVIRRLKEEGVTMLMVEQSANRALEVADRAYVLQNGRVVLEGPAHELAADPAVRRAYLGETA